MLRCDDNSKMKLALDARSLGRRILGRLSLCFMTWWMKILSLTWRLVKVYEDDTAMKCFGWVKQLQSRIINLLNADMNDYKRAKQWVK
ncbi:unnamed protein product [Trifolium pratense]|uniref:Uncharacterized protein n=1 Tax=Trifolium pratense TaxID=57577 RepID=A0ACB0KG64_TRIPR|nr:unnamed protein product [Trifolium pratense]